MKMEVNKVFVLHGQRSKRNPVVLFTVRRIDTISRPIRVK